MAVRLMDTSDANRSAPATARWFGPGLALLAVLGVAMRIIFTSVWTYGTPLSGDPFFYQRTAAELAHGHGYVIPFLDRGASVATALHPPFFSVVLAALDLIGLGSTDAHRMALSVMAAGSIVAMGFLGRRVRGPVVGLSAAGIAAFGPLWIQTSGKVLSESVYLVIIPIVLLAALRCLERPTLLRFFVVGLTIGVAALTRGEANTLVLLLGAPLVVLASHRWRQRLRLGLVLLAGFVLLVGPWLVRNDVQLGGLTLSTDSGTTLVGANSHSTFSPDSPLYGSFDQPTQFGDAAYLYRYGHPPGHGKKWTELTLSNALGHIGKSYALGHMSDLPGVVLAREGRLWGLYASGSQLSFDLASDDNGVPLVQEAGQYVNWILLPMAVVGGIVLYRLSRRDLVVLAAPIVAAALSAALTFGSTRYRTVAEPSMAVLAAVGIVWLIAGLRTAAGQRRAVPAPGAGAPTPVSQT